MQYQPPPSEEPEPSGQPDANSQSWRNTVLTLSRRKFLQSSVAAAALSTSGVKAGAGPTVSSAGSSPAMSAPMSPHLTAVPLQINGRGYTLDIEPRVTLLDALREHAGLFGTKKGCDRGQCGACTVLVNGARINSCLTLAVMHVGAEITTIEGLGTPENLHPMQAAFVERDALQCGYCTPGQICSAVGLLHEVRQEHALVPLGPVAGLPRVLDDDVIRERMSGNICRCGAYPNIVQAIQDVAQSQTAMSRAPAESTAPSPSPKEAAT